MNSHFAEIGACGGSVMGCMLPASPLVGLRLPSAPPWGTRYYIGLFTPAGTRPFHIPKASYHIGEYLQLFHSSERLKCI